jgi:1,2-diacylglycerol 3-alpha-glucosyltransferase
LRIALFSDSAFPILNGVSVSVDRLRSSLIKLGHEVNLYAPDHPEAARNEEGITRIPSWITPFARRYPFCDPFWLRGYEGFAQQEFDLLHLHNPFFAGSLALRWAKRSGLPLVGSFHTDFRRCLAYCPAPLGWGGAFAAMQVRRIFRACDLAIVPSETAGAWLSNYGVQTPQVVVPTGVEISPPMDRQTLRRSLGFKRDEVILLSVGRLAPEKNPLAIIESFALTAKDVQRARLVIVGDGPLMNKLKARVHELDLEPRVRFTGPRSPSETAAFLAASDALAMTSFNETQGLVVLEAMSHGLPVVAVNQGGASEQVSDGIEGWVTNSSPSEIAKAVNTILSQSNLRSKMSQAAMAKGRSWTSLAHAEKMVQYYRSVLGHDHEVEQESVVIGEEQVESMKRVRKP